MENLVNNVEFVEWLNERMKVSVEHQDEATLQKLYGDYQREQEYDVKLGF
ncbi:MAG: hypothetical protein ACRDDL_03495 [Sarcina sp.]